MELKRREFIKKSFSALVTLPVIIKDSFGLENLVLTNSSEEEITTEQHKKEIKKLVNYYIARMGEANEGKFADKKGDLVELHIVFNDEKLKEYRNWEEKYDQWYKLFHESTEAFGKMNEFGISSSEKKELGKILNETHKKMRKIERTFSIGLGDSILRPTDYTAIKYDLENNVFYLRREPLGQERFYAQDIGANGMQLYTKDFIRTNKDLEVPGHKYEGYEITNKEEKWKKASAELAQQYMSEVHNIVKILERRYPGKYGFRIK